MDDQSIDIDIDDISGIADKEKSRSSKQSSKISRLKKQKLQCAEEQKNQL